MSDYEIKIGKACEVKFGDGLAFAQKVRILKGNGESFDEDEAVDGHYFGDSGFFSVGDRIFKIIEKVDCEGYEDIAFAQKDGDGVISYVLKYYNGGTCFNEMIEQAIEEMEKE